MNAASGDKRAGGAPRVDADEIIKNARRRRRAADSRRRTLLGEGADGDGLAVDGTAVLQPAVEPLTDDDASPPLDAPTQTPRRSATPSGKPASRRKPAPAPTTTARAPFVLGVLAMLAVGIVGLLLLNTAINENAFVLQDMRENQAALDASEQELTDDLAELTAPGNLAAAAERLGLEPAEDVTYLRLPDGKELKMPTPGGG